MVRNDTLLGGGGIVMGVKANVQCLLAAEEDAGAAKEAILVGVVAALNELCPMGEIVLGEEAKDKLGGTEDIVNVDAEGMVMGAGIPATDVGDVFATMAFVVLDMLVTVLLKCTPEERLRWR